MAGNQYRDYIKRSFLKYAFSIISLLFVLMGLFLFINVQWISVGSNRKNNALLLWTARCHPIRKVWNTFPQITAFWMP